MLRTGVATDGSDRRDVEARSSALLTVRHALRQLRQSRGFAAVALATIAVGVGACITIFSAVDGLLLHPLPYPAADRLVVLNETNLPQFPEFPVAPGQYFDWKTQATAFDGIASLKQDACVLVATGEPVGVSVGRVTANLFAVLQTPALLGRTFSPEDEIAGNDASVVLSHGFWRRHFGARPDVLQQKINLDGRPHTIVGVAPSSLQAAGAVDLYTPAIYDGTARQNRGGRTLSMVVGRLKDGVSIRQAEGELKTIAQRQAAQFPITNKGWSVKVTPMLDALVGDVSAIVFTLFGAVGFLLLIACANVANLLLVRATARSKEIAVRSALGATPGRVFRQMLIESLVLAVLGSALGVLLGFVGTKGLVAIAPAGTPRLEEIGMSGKVLLFACALTLLTSVLFGLAPAVQAAFVKTGQVLREGGRGTSGARRQFFRGALVVIEVALAFMLLAGASTFITSFARLQNVAPGFQPADATVASLALAPGRYATPVQQALFAGQAVARLAALPGVTAAGASQALPLSGGKIVFQFQAADQQMPNPPPAATYYAVTPDYFKAMGIPILRGRPFASTDVAGAAPVAIINQALARQFFGAGDPIGKRISISNGPTTWREIVGVAGNVKHDDLVEAPSPQVYEPFDQKPWPAFSIVVRAPGQGGALSADIRTAIHALDQGQPMPEVRTFKDYLVAATAGERFAMMLFVAFSAIALVLAAVGIYGVLAYVVSQRTAELGIRMALGAPPRTIVRMVLFRAARLVAIGVGCGSLGALLLGVILAAILYGVAPIDPMILGATAAILIFVTGLASIVPARRAIRVDPIIAMRTDAS